MKVSNCCGALFYEPGYPDCDICTACKEHADPIEEEEPSIEVIEMPTLTDDLINKMKEVVVARWKPEKDNKGPVPMFNWGNVMEDKIKLLMVMEGYDRHRISFRGDSRRYMVYKYWEPITDHSLEYVSIHTNAVFNVEEIYDDDCGFLYSYTILYKS